MFRAFGSDKKGTIFDLVTMLCVWEKATPIAGEDESEVRLDRYGFRVRRVQHGNTSSAEGWEIDHINPVANGGTDDLWNLQPLQWQVNRAKSDTVGQFELPPKPYIFK